MASPKSKLRLRIFAGPNGSGKSVVIDLVRNTVVNGYPVDVGLYINADNIASALSTDFFDFSDYSISVSLGNLTAFAATSGLLKSTFDAQFLKKNLSIRNGMVRLKVKDKIDQVAQLIARYLRELLLESQKRFSFETVFSHPSNIEFMARAKEAGYKIYLYYVATESEEINVFRVENRVLSGGHAVPNDKIRSRYMRSLELLSETLPFVHQAFFFDNSKEGEDALKLVNHCERQGDDLVWDIRNSRKFPIWFKKYCWDKIS